MKSQLVNKSLNEFARSNGQYQDKPTMHPDLTKIEGSLGQALEPLLKSVDQYDSVEDLKDAFWDIISSPDVKISRQKSHKYLMDIENLNSIDRMQSFIRDVYLKSANLGL